MCNLTTFLRTSYENGVLTRFFENFDYNSSESDCPISLSVSTSFSHISCKKLWKNFLCRIFCKTVGCPTKACQQNLCK